MHFAGFVRDEELVRLLNEATCAVIPSLYEPFGIVALEALAAGAPLVAAESGGLREVLTGTDAGLVFPPGNAGALAAAFERMLTEPGLVEKCQAAGTQLVATKYSWDAIAARPSRCTPTRASDPRRSRRRRATRASREGAPQLQRPCPAARTARPAGDAGHEPALVVGQETRDLFRWVDPDVWEATRHDPVAVDRGRATRGACRPWPRTRASCATSPRLRTSSAATSRTTAGSS